MAALCMTGESECFTGSPTMARTRLVAATRVTQLALQALDRGADQCLKLRVSRPIELEVSAKRVADLGLGAGAAGVLAENMGAAFTSQLVHPGPMMPCHGEDQLRLLHHVPGQQPRAMTGEIQVMLQPYEVGAF